MTEKIAPLPCPFCGEAPHFGLWHSDASTAVALMCKSANCSEAPAVTAKTESELTPIWNNRALTARVKELEEALNSLVDYAMPEMTRGPAIDGWLDTMEAALPFITDAETRMDIQSLVHVGRAALNKEPTT